ncbi:beta-glucosidase BglX [Enterococcus gilvus]|uniref:beta-glucosidase BglX n=1 Tax=Enterococcus gilvus TaxID=160453 RepID=UPI002908DEA7|nr:beta-glucosidase BglX [Enterococcus gilvus]MDU5511827.1 beta-glucosidase BglX [Enterococcus gilvus]
MQEAKLRTLLDSLTWTEKVGQLVQLSGDFFHSEELAVGPKKKLGITQETIDVVGSVLNVTGAETTRDIQEKYLKNSRHQIPLLFMADIIYGYRTIFPIPLGLGATWNPALIEEAYGVIARESRSAGAHVTYAPMVDLVRDARWGRCLESTGEDPQLNADFSAAMVRGLQQEYGGDFEGIASCVKHFAAYGAAEAGREYNTVDMSERRLRQEYLSGYKSAVDAGAKMVMTSFNTYDGVPVTGNEFLLKELLREEWGFDGVIISDYAAVQELIAHGVARDEREATLLAMQATNDIDMKTGCYANELAPLVKEGALDPGLVNDAVWRVLKLKNDLGLFEDPYRGSTVQKEQDTLLTEENRALARKVAQEAIVLLQNKEELLPLTPNKETILLVGPYGDEQDLIGLWAVHGKSTDVVSIKAALEKELTQETFAFEKGCDLLADYQFLGEFGATKEQIHSLGMTESEKEAALNKALEAGRQADVIIYAMGEHTMQSGEAGSRTDISLPAIQKEFIEKMTALGKKNILVAISGRPLTLTKEVEQMDAIIQAWFPGTEGGNALVDILFGKANPSGRLSMGFPENVGQLPMYYNEFKTGRPLNSSTHRGRFVTKYLDSPNSPLFPFGFGLSYGTVSYEELTLSTTQMTEKLSVSIKLKNTSEYEQLETVQLYVQDVTGSVVRPVKELKDYQKVALRPKEEKVITFTLQRSDLYYYMKDMQFGTEAGEFLVFVGRNSADTVQAAFELL